MYWTHLAVCGESWLATAPHGSRTWTEATMNARCRLGILMSTCFVAGALGANALHGETKPPAYLIGQIDVTDPNGYAKEYLPKAREIIKAHGGKLVAAAGAAAGAQVVGVDGTPPKR